MSTPPLPPPPPGPGQYYAPPPSQGGGNRTLLIVLIVAGILLLVCIGGCFTCMYMGKQGLEQAAEEMSGPALRGAAKEGAAEVKRLEAEASKLPVGSPERAQKELELQQSRQALEIMKSMSGGSE